MNDVLYNIVLSMNDKVVLEMNWTTGELVVTGDMDEGAKMFFDVILKPNVDTYIKDEHKKLIEENEKLKEENKELDESVHGGSFEL